MFSVFMVPCFRRDRVWIPACAGRTHRIVVDREKCIGCGLCVSFCPTESISMGRKPANETFPIFSDQLALLKALGVDKGKAYPFE